MLLLDLCRWMRFPEMIFPQRLVKKTPKMGLVFGLFCLSDRGSFLQKGFVFYCIIWWGGCHFLFHAPSLQKPLLLLHFSYPVKWLYVSSLNVGRPSSLVHDEWRRICLWVCVWPSGCSGDCSLIWNVTPRLDLQPPLLGLINLPRRGGY